MMFDTYYLLNHLGGQELSYNSISSNIQEEFSCDSFPSLYIIKTNCLVIITLPLGSLLWLNLWTRPVH